MQAAGTVLNNQYRIETVLGQGGMGSVYLARDARFDRLVAIKELEPGGAQHQSALRQFRHEAAVLRQLQHPALPKVHDYFEIGAIGYLVMDYIKGRTLATIVAEEEPLTPAMVLKWAGELCDVLEYLHQHKPVVVFRDLKPGNVILDVDARIKLIDFGISKLFDAAAPAATATFARGCVSPGYTAPEQYSGGSDARSDIYSLGATLYALLGRTLPVPAVDRAAEIATLVPLQSLRPNLPGPLVTAVNKLMAVNTSDRPQNIAEVRLVLGLRAPEFADMPTMRSDWRPPSGRGLADADPNATLPPPRPVRRRRPQSNTAVWWGGGAAFVIVGLAVFNVVRPSSTPPGAPALQPPQRQAGRLEVTSEPVGARVEIDGELRGVTPLSLDFLPPNTYHLKLSQSGYASQEQDIGVLQGQSQTVDLKLMPLHHQLALTVHPAHAWLYIDGGSKRQIGETVTLTMTPGHHVLKLKHAGYQTLQRAVDMAADTASMPASLTLDPVPRASRVAARPTPAPTPSADRTVVVLPPSPPSPPESTEAPASPVPLDLSNPVIVPGRSVGPFVVGETFVAAARAEGSLAPGPDGSTAYLFHGGRLAVHVRDGRVVAVLVRKGTGIDFHTVDGVRFGDVQSAISLPITDHQRWRRGGTALFTTGTVFIFGPNDGLRAVLVGDADEPLLQLYQADVRGVQGRGRRAAANSDR